ncbi:MAG: DUF1501 domain-containing protein [Propionibacteriaceae bacterium]
MSLDHPDCDPPPDTSDRTLRRGVGSLTRRRFLACSGVVAGAALAAGATQVQWHDLLAAAGATPLDPSAGVLVVVALYGGNDGLNTVIPADDPTYQRARPDLAYRADEVLDLGDGLGLNPGMTGLKALWDRDELAIVRGVGYPAFDHSHFRSMAIWQTASPETPLPTGWLGRWLDASTTDPLDAVSLEPVLPALLAGSKLAAASFPLSGLKLPTGKLSRAFEMLGVASPEDGPWQAAAAKSVADLKLAASTLGPAANTKPSVSPAPSTDPGSDSEDPNGGKGASAGGNAMLDAQLQMVANLVEMGVPTRAYSVSLGGFDTYSDERGTQQRLLAELDAALSRFQARLDRTGRGRQVVTMVYSEFGRRVQANGSDGTDHGTAGPMFVLGRGVQGGFHGAEPSLTDLDNGDLRATTDFRSVYATILDQVLGADPGAVLGGWDQRVELLSG